MFSHYTRVLASIPRWSVLPVIRRQYVAEHSYYVSLYVHELLAHPAYSYMDAEWKLCALRYALVHDVEESRMSDIPGPVKRMIKDDDKLKSVERRVFEGLDLPVPYVDDKIKKLVKAADLIDEYFYINIEMSYGNRIASRVHWQVKNRLESALIDAGVHDVLMLIEQECHDLDAGLITLSNNDDVPVANLESDIPF